MGKNKYYVFRSMLLPIVIFHLLFSWICVHTLIRNWETGNFLSPVIGIIITAIIVVALCFVSVMIRNAFFICVSENRVYIPRILFKKKSPDGYYFLRIPILELFGKRWIDPFPAKYTPSYLLVYQFQVSNIKDISVASKTDHSFNMNSFYANKKKKTVHVVFKKPLTNILGESEDDFLYYRQIIPHERVIFKVPLKSPLNEIYFSMNSPEKFIKDIKSRLS